MDILSPKICDPPFLIHDWSLDDDYTSDSETIEIGLLPEELALQAIADAFANTAFAKINGEYYVVDDELDLGGGAAPVLYISPQQLTPQRASVLQHVSIIDDDSDDPDDDLVAAVHAAVAPIPTTSHTTIVAPDDSPRRKRKSPPKKSRGKRIKTAEPVVIDRKAHFVREEVVTIAVVSDCEDEEVDILF